MNANLKYSAYTFSFVIPVYNEEKNIPLIYDKLMELMQTISEKYEIIFVNDGSADNSLQLLKDYAAKDNSVKYINFSRNFGHQAALTAGLSHAKGDAIISLDCDLQDPPEVIASMIDKWNEGYDIVYARRRKRHDRFFKKYSAILYYKILERFSDVRIPRDVGDFRLINKKALQTLNSMPEKAKYLRGMVAWIGYKYTFVDFDRPERIHGETHYTLSKMLQLSMHGLINFSSLPLKLGFLLGLITIATGILFLMYMIIDVFINSAYYPLYKFLVVILFIFVGFLFILIWVLGEYIGRIYEESKNRPLYIIDHTVNFNKNLQEAANNNENK